MRIFVINLDDCFDRLAQQKQQFDKLNLSFKRISATCASNVDTAYYHHIQQYAQRPTKKAEVACFLSHKKAWEQVIKANKPCVILEDDAILVNDFSKILSEIEQLTDNDIDLINLEVQPRYKIVAKNPSYHLVNQDYALYRLFLDKSGTGGYVLYPSGAKKLLNHSRHHFALADAFIYHCPKLKMYQIEPAALLQDVICPLYNINPKNFSASSILSTPNVSSSSFGFKQKIAFKKNRIKTQLYLGCHTLASQTKGVKRKIDVHTHKFTDNIKDNR